MDNWQQRTAMLLSEEGLDALAAARVAVIGLGGVGACAAEMLARAGVGHLLLIDSDCVSETNLNRQLIALHSTIGLGKAEAVRARLLDINPKLEVTLKTDFLAEDNVAALVEAGTVDYVVDAIDTLSPKIALIQHCLKNGIRLVSSMGSGAKIDATAVRLADISQTKQCPLARMLRKRLHKLGIETGFQAVYSAEVPNREGTVIEESRNKKSQVGSVSYLPAVFGCVCAQAVILGICGI